MQPATASSRREGENATGLNPDANITAKFSEAMKARSINANTFRSYQSNFTYEEGH
jgi:hypothetical protein